MINLLVGRSGSGKSYEVCVYHVLEAVKRGRKVITNLPLRMETWEAFFPEQVHLIELRKKAQPIRGNWEPTREQGAYVVRDQQFWTYPDTTARVFAGVWDYYDDWRHPETGQGALFVVDEAQNVIPAKGTDKSVEEWTALHRHWVCDVIYITQSYRKLSEAIRDNIQIVYRFTKKTAWGQPDRYIRKVQDGVRGEVLNVTERTYEKKYFSLYRSHTQGEAGSEAMADDIVPYWKHWSFMGAGLCLVIFIAMLASGLVKNPMKVPEKAFHAKQTKPQKPINAVPKANAGPDVHIRPAAEPVAQPQSPAAAAPLTGRGVHIVAHVKSATREVWRFAVSQNGQYAFMMDLRELEEAGYTFRALGECLAQIEYAGMVTIIACDAPTQAIRPASIS